MKASGKYKAKGVLLRSDLWPLSTLMADLWPSAVCGPDLIVYSEDSGPLETPLVGRGQTVEVLDPRLRKEFEMIFSFQTFYCTISNMWIMLPVSRPKQRRRLKNWSASNFQAAAVDKCSYFLFCYDSGSILCVGVGQDTLGLRCCWALGVAAVQEWKHQNHGAGAGAGAGAGTGAGASPQQGSWTRRGQE